MPLKIYSSSFRRRIATRKTELLNELLIKLQCIDMFQLIEEREIRTVSDRFKSGPCNRFLPEPDVNCLLIFSKLVSVSSAL